MTFKINRVFTALLLSTFVFAGTAAGQNKQLPVNSGKVEQNFSNSDIKSFAKAYIAVQQEMKSARLDVSKAESPEDKRAAKKKFQQKAMKAGSGEGLSMKKYSQIARKTRQNKKFYQKVVKEIQAAQKKQAE